MTPRLHPEDIEAIARRVVELQRAQAVHQPEKPTMLDVKAMAAHLDVSTAFVYEHAHELGGVKLSDSPKAPWRFDLQRATAAMLARVATSPQPRRATPQRRSPAIDTTPSGLPLLPIRGKAT